LIESSTPIAMVGLLYALPGTQLTRRLARERRLHDTFDRVDNTFDGGDQCTAGLNYDTSRPLIDILRDFREIVDKIYRPEAYFARVKVVTESLDCSQKQLKLSLWHYLRHTGLASRLAARIIAQYRWLFWSTLFSLLRRSPKGFAGLNLMAFFLHFGPSLRRRPDRRGDCEGKACPRGTTRRLVESR
jgi:hypothetical protein